MKSEWHVISAPLGDYPAVAGYEPFAAALDTRYPFDQEWIVFWRRLTPSKEPLPTHPDAALRST